MKSHIIDFSIKSVTRIFKIIFHFQKSVAKIAEIFPKINYFKL